MSKTKSMESQIAKLTSDLEIANRLRDVFFRKLLAMETQLFVLNTAINKAQSFTEEL